MSRSKENQDYYNNASPEEQQEFIRTEQMINNVNSSGGDDSYWFVRTLPIIIIGFFLIPVILVAKLAGIGSSVSEESLFLICTFPWICGMISEIVISQRFLVFLVIVILGVPATLFIYGILSPSFGV